MALVIFDGFYFAIAKRFLNTPNKGVDGPFLHRERLGQEVTCSNACVDCLVSVRKPRSELLPQSGRTLGFKASR